MKFLTIPIAKNNAVGVNSTPESTMLMFRCPNTKKEIDPEMVQVNTTDEEITTFLKLSPKATEALRILLNQEIVNE